MRSCRGNEGITVARVARENEIAVPGCRYLHTDPSDESGRRNIRGARIYHFMDTFGVFQHRHGGPRTNVSERRSLSSEKTKRSLVQIKVNQQVSLYLLNHYVTNQIHRMFNSYYLKTPTSIGVHAKGLSLQ